MIDPNNKISLIFRREDFEEIYFKNNQGDPFWGSTVKQHFIIVLLFAGAFLVSLSYALYADRFWGIPIVCFFIFVLSFFSYHKHAAPIIAWKKQVVKYLDDLSNIKKQELSLTNEALTIIQDDQMTITKWATFTKATLSDEAILLTGTDNYVFPKKSMSLVDYKYLKESISGVIRNGI